MIEQYGDSDKRNEQIKELESKKEYLQQRYSEYTEYIEKHKYDGMSYEELLEVEKALEANVQNAQIEYANNFDSNYVTIDESKHDTLNHLNIHGVGLGDLFIKFIKTPSNLLRASIKYSPAGFVKATSDYIKFNRSLKNGQFDAKLQRKFVNNLSKSITGTLLYVVFGFLAHAGVISGGADDDKDVAAFEKNILGVQPYSVKIGDYSFSYEWAQPIASGMAFMSTEIAVAIIAFAGTALGTFGGILTSSKLTNYRIQQLEKKVDEHNNFARRVPVIEEQIKVINHRIQDLEVIQHE